VIGTVSVRYAFRSLFRHTRRSLLSVFGVGIGCAIGLVASAFYAGSSAMQVRAVSESGGGHLRVVPENWTESRRNSLRLVETEATLETVRGISQVAIAVPRSRTTGLLAFGNRTTGVEIAGVVPDLEHASNRIVSESTIEGRYLQADDEGNVVVGKSIADRLNVGLDDDLLATISGPDEIASAMFRIVGILSTGNRDLDSTVCHVTLGYLSGLCETPDAGEITVLLKDYRVLDDVRDELSVTLTNSNTVVTWREVNPMIAGNVEGDTAFIRMLSFIIMVVVVLGVASAQLTSFLERRHEFGVLTALGMKGRQIVLLVIIEALMIGVGGAIAALALGAPAAYWLHVKGVNFAELMGDLNVANVLFEPHIYGQFGPWIITYAFAVSLAATAVASLYPAWFAARVNPASELRPN
jgi:ABC-type lipoprotein release transport system permease subunit